MSLTRRGFIVSGAAGLAGVGGAPNRYLDHVRRLCKQHSSSTDQLLTLAT